MIVSHGTKEGEGPGSAVNVLMMASSNVVGWAAEDLPLVSKILPCQ